MWRKPLARNGNLVQTKLSEWTKNGLGKPIRKSDPKKT